jgi:predicted porin
MSRLLDDIDIRHERVKLFLLLALVFNRVVHSFYFNTHSGKYLMNKFILAASLLTASSFSALGQDSFTSIIGAGYATSDNNDSYNINGSYFLSPVDITKGPLGEAVFLNRSNALRAGLNRSESDLQDKSLSSNFWNLGGTYHLNNSGLFINVDVAHVNNSIGPNSKSYALGGGYYLSDDWFVTIDTMHDKDFKYQNMTVGTKKLIDLGEDSFISLNASVTNKNYTYNVGADYYFNKRLSVGLAHTWYDDFDVDTTSINANWFITDTISVSLGINKLDNGTSTDNKFNFGASARF